MFRDRGVTNDAHVTSTVLSVVTACDGVADWDAMYLAASRRPWQPCAGDNGLLLWRRACGRRGVVAVSRRWDRALRTCAVRTVARIPVIAGLGPGFRPTHECVDCQWDQHQTFAHKTRAGPNRRKIVSLTEGDATV